MRIVPGPDFPTGGIIVGRSGIRGAYETGRETIIIRARSEFEDMARDREAIIINEIPYQVNKKTLLERIGELVREKQVEGISGVRDESDRSGMRIVIELKRDATPEVVLNQLYRFTQLQITFGINMLALDGGRPRQLGLRDALLCFIRVPRRGDRAARALRAGEGAQERSQPRRPRHRRRQHRRGDPPDPRQFRRSGRAHRVDVG